MESNFCDIREHEESHCPVGNDGRKKKAPCTIGKSQDIKDFYQWWNCKVTKKSQDLLIEDLLETDDKSSKRKCSSVHW